MSTLRDMKTTLELVQFTSDLFGCEEAFREEYSRRLQEIGAEQAAGIGVPKEEMAKLLHEEGQLDQALTPKAKQLFAEMKDWLKTQHEVFARM